MSVRLCVMTLCICFSELDECIFFRRVCQTECEDFSTKTVYIYSKVGGVDVTLIEGEQIIK